MPLGWLGSSAARPQRVTAGVLCPQTPTWQNEILVTALPDGTQLGASCARPQPPNVNTPHKRRPVNLAVDRCRILPFCHRVENRERRLLAVEMQKSRRTGQNFANARASIALARRLLSSMFFQRRLRPNGRRQLREWQFDCPRSCGADQTQRAT